MYNDEVINKIKDILIKRGETIACAESVTAGNLQVAFLQAMDASQYFQGGITAYNVGQKTRHLNIEPILALTVDSVDPRIAAALALEVSKKFLSNFGVGITGYATLVPQCEHEGLYAFFAVAYNNKIVLTQKLKGTKENNYAVQLEYTDHALNAILTWLQQNVPAS